MKYLPALLSILAFPVMAATGFNVDSLLTTVIYLVVLGLIVWLLFWFIGYVGLPAPFDKVARVVIALVVLIVLVTFLMKFLPA